MADDLDTLITDAMRACIGRQLPLHTIPEPIPSSDIRRYCQAVGDDNPLWWNDEVARAAGYRERRAPHLMITQMGWRLGDRDPESLDESEWSGLVYPAGFTNFRNGGQEVEWLAPVYIGDLLSFQSRLTEIYARQGRMGPMIITKTETEIRNQDDIVVARTTRTGIRLRAARYEEARG